MTLDEIPTGTEREHEVLVDTSSYVRVGGLAWCRIKKISPNARFPVVVTVPEVGNASYTIAEVRDVRPVT